MGRKRKYVLRCSSNSNHMKLNRHTSKCETKLPNGKLCFSSLECQCPFCFIWLPRYKTSSHECIRKSKAFGINAFPQEKKRNSMPQQRNMRRNPVNPVNINMRRRRNNDTEMNGVFEDLISPIINPPPELKHLFPVLKSINVKPYVPEKFEKKRKKKKILPCITSILSKPISFSWRDILLPGMRKNNEQGNIRNLLPQQLRIQSNFENSNQSNLTQQQLQEQYVKQSQMQNQMNQVPNNVSYRNSQNGYNQNSHNGFRNVHNGFNQNNVFNNYNNHQNRFNNPPNVNNPPNGFNPPNGYNNMQNRFNNPQNGFNNNIQNRFNGMQNSNTNHNPNEMTDD